MVFKCEKSGKMFPSELLSLGVKEFRWRLSKICLAPLTSRILLTERY
jgi:hypothetical protein